MQVSIKDFAISMDVKTNGVEFEVRDNEGSHQGDCYVTKTGLVWCKGKVPRQHGVSIPWAKFMKWAAEQAKD